ncbi:hypothetical protein BCR35DRAFT_152005 [Leucosporidium creatinivorum]|uniref:BZIP domain-containing protein n=1 Tax=Leucosporidium creatinivorum TaxID=106004 RepID=A0A1Y2EPH4_9BASI|nr:hypothetical protein BCR35DRAFT_152005 [Leucosporidium creatinivorum]
MSSALASSLSGTNSPSPWSRFISPSAFLDLNSPKTATRPTSPQSVTLHNREINPFEQSFAPDNVVAARKEGDARPIRRKRPSPAELEEEKSRKAARDAKRPKLRLGLGAQGSGSSSAASTISSGVLKSFSDSSRSKSTTISPDSSVAPSPASEPKVDTGSLINQLAVSAAMAAPAPFHYQPAPLPITLNAAGSEFGQPFQSNVAPSSTFIPSTFGPSAPFAAFAPDNLTFDPYAALPPALLQPVALPELPIPPPLDLAGQSLYPNAEVPLAAGKKRGRKPKNAPTVSQAELEQERREALDRNRIAASRSRQRKKERVGNLESTAQNLANNNAALQAECIQLRADVDSLRALLEQVHPQPCSCEHVQGYLARERDGGGIPTIERIAGDTLTKDYRRLPASGSQAEAEEARSREAEQASMVETVVEERSTVAQNAIPLRRRG